MSILDDLMGEYGFAVPKAAYDKLQEHIAARQPVGQAYRVNGVDADGSILHVHPGGVESGATLYASPHAQAVDLGKFRRPIEEWRADMKQWIENHGDAPGQFYRDIEEADRLLALIDGQAVQ